LLNIPNKIGALYNILLNSYLDIILVRNLNDHTKIFKSENKNHASCQSINYSLLIESLKYFDIKNADNVVDVGSGFGRIVLFLKWKYGISNITGYEINKTANKVSRKNCQGKGIKILDEDILDSKLTHCVYILFNPFNGLILEELLYKNKEITGFKLVFINAYEEHIAVFKKSKYKDLQIHVLHNLYKGIEGKKLVIAEY